MRVILVLLLTGLVTILSSIEASAAGRPGRVALVIGNGKYPDNGVVMNEAVNDAQDFADELKRDGFEVDRVFNATGDAMRQALERFYAKIQNGDVALFFFDGFGVSTQRKSYLLPVDVQIWEESDVAHEGINFESILQEMHSRGASVKIAVLDASRRNPYERRYQPFSGGLAPAIAPTNSLILYSAANNAVISSARTDHGLFVTELLREIRVPGTTAEQAFKNTQAGVVAATRNEQVPWFSSSLTTDFYFIGGGLLPPMPTPIPIVPPTPTPSPTPTSRPACVLPTPPRPPGAEELANDPRISEYTRRIQRDPNDRIAHYKRGQLYAIKGAYALAVTDFDQAIKLNVRDAESYNNRCWTRAATDNLLDALRDCNEALRLKPDLYDALDSRGLVNLKLGRYADAIRDYNASLEQNPRSVSSMYGRGLATRRSGGDGSADLDQARSMDHNIASEFAGYGVNACEP